MLRTWIFYFSGQDLYLPILRCALLQSQNKMYSWLNYCSSKPSMYALVWFLVLIIELPPYSMGKCNLEIEFKTEFLLLHSHYLVSFSEQVEKIISELLLRMPTLNFGLVVAKRHYLAFIHHKNAFVNSFILSCPQRAAILCQERILIRHSSHQMAPSGF